MDARVTAHGHDDGYEEAEGNDMVVDELFEIRLLMKPAKRVIISQGRRALQACSGELYSSSDSFEPASLKMSSDASSSITSMMSSTVIRPTRIPVESRTGREVGRI